MIKNVPLASLLLFSSLSTPLAFASDFSSCVVELQKPPKAKVCLPIPLKTL